MSKNLEDILYKVVDIAIQAGYISMKYYGECSYELKDDNSPLTMADLESNAYIIESLQEFGYKICSEESVLAYEERKDLEYYWLVDPLDGTKDFLAHNGGFTVNIALIHQNRPILGVVYAPCFYDVYFALRGFGAYKINVKLNDNIGFIKENKLLLSGERMIDDSNIVACDSMFHSTKENEDFFKKYDLKVLKCGSSLKVCSLAEGRADIYPRFNGTSEWDMAACDVILEESGGLILDCVSKQKLQYNKSSVRNNHFIAFSKSQIGQKIYNEFLYS